MLSEETIKLIKAAQPNHGLDKAIEIFSQVQLKKIREKKSINQKISNNKYTDWIHQSISDNLLFHLKLIK